MTRPSSGVSTWCVLGIGVVAVAGASVSLAQSRLLGADHASGRLIEIDPSTGAATVIGPFSHSFVASLAWDSTDRVLYATTSDSTTSLLLRVNPDTGATTSVGPLGTFFMHGIEYHAPSDTLYGVASGPGGQRLYRIDRGTGAATLVAPVGVTGIIDLAFDQTTGVMYLSEVLGQRLRTVNLASGGTTIVGPFDAPGMPFPQVGIGMAFDPALGLFASDNTGVAGNPNPLYRVNTTTGHATLVGLMPFTGVLGLAFVTGCSADFNHDGFVTGDDFDEYVVEFIAGNPAADFNGDGFVTGDDFDAFVVAFVAGC